MAAAEGQVISCHSLDQWREQIEKGKESKKLLRLMYCLDFNILHELIDRWWWISRLHGVDFIAPILAEFAKKMTDVIFLKVDVDELESVADEWSVEAMPTFIFLKDGKIIDRVVGAKKDELHRTIVKHYADTAPVTASA